MAFVVKLLNSDGSSEPRWVMTAFGLGFGCRETATAFPDRESAEEEAGKWKAMRQNVFSVVVEPA
jgi:hypothetical protein